MTQSNTFFKLTTRSTTILNQNDLLRLYIQHVLTSTIQNLSVKSTNIFKGFKDKADVMFLYALWETLGNILVKAEVLEFAPNSSR